MLSFLRLRPEISNGTDLSSTGESEISHVEPEIVVSNCRCCGTMVKFPDSVVKYRCSVCRSTQTMANRVAESEDDCRSITFQEVITIVECCHGERAEKDVHACFKPLEKYVTEMFGSFGILNRSFQKKGDHRLEINNREVQNIYELLVAIPTKRPYVKLLIAVNELLRRPPKILSTCSDLRWLLILWELPTLKDCLYHNKKTKVTSKLDTPEIKSLSYEIIKRIIGYLGNTDKQSLNSLASYLHSQSTSRVASKVQLINLYITFRLTRIINRTHQPLLKISGSQGSTSTSSPGLTEYSESSKLNSISTSTPISSSFGLQLRAGMDVWNNWQPSKFKKDPITLKVNDYGNEWHIKCAAKLLSVLFVSNKPKVAICDYYNTLTDYINVKQDFEVWQSCFKKIHTDDPISNANRAFYEILNLATMNSGLQAKMPQFTFCQFPFLLTLGAKISILEYESRRMMERKAEEAFIHSLDCGHSSPMNLVFKVRRAHITSDSLRCIQEQRKDLKKALKIEFVGEPGIDVGGLKKEWFELLTKNLFKQDNGMFFYNDESNLCWFAPMPVERNEELFFLVGVVLGLAIYNPTILDLKFPLALYKKLLGKRLHLDDYIELFPSTGKGLKRLLECRPEEVELMGMYFETSFKDLFGVLINKELIPNGSQVLVTHKNRHEYVSHWIDFYMNSAIEHQFTSFYNGFQTVIGGNGISLFNAREIQMIICGDNDTKIDTASLRSVTRYVGWNAPMEDPSACPVVKWFWEWFDALTHPQQKKFLSFVTGSSRVPATGISTMSFKITKLPSYGVCKLPLAHTCFNELCLYDSYKSREQFVHMMEISVSESEGFGMK